jgi:serine/threonine protein kinase
MGGLRRRLTGMLSRSESGERLGRYQLLESLGAGGMAEIFKARALGPAGFERDVVIKRILSTHGSDQEFIRMFEDEAKILGMLHHPNVVQVYDFGDEDGVLFLALEFVDGPSVSRVLRTLRSANRKMPPAIAAYVAREVSRALDYVHNLEDGQGARLDVIHRDVTPSNVVLASAGGVKLLDFGVATFRAAAQISRSGTVKGKPAYLAPEQLEGKAIDARVDLFALGIVLHEMLSLQHLFAGDSDLGTVKKIMEMEIPRPSARRDDVPAELDRIVMRALERDRRRRFASAAEMAAALDDVVVASQLRLDEVVTFVRDVEAMTRASALRSVAAPAAVARRVRARARAVLGQVAGDEGPTRKERGLLLQIKHGGRALAARPRAAFLVGLVLLVLGLSAAFGFRVTTIGVHDRTAAAAATTPASVAAPPLPLPSAGASVQGQR